MKKIFVCLLTICLGLSLTASAQSAYEKQKAKQAKKEYKQKVKECKKDGWQISGSSHTLEMALLDHYIALEKVGVSEVTGVATSGSKNVATDLLAQNASRQYAQMVNESLRGKMTEDMSSNKDEQISEFEHFYSAYETKLEAEIKGVLKPSYTLIREIKVNGKKVYEFERHYLLDEDSASKARLRAYEQAAKETYLAQMDAEQISEYLKKSFGE